MEIIEEELWLISGDNPLKAAWLLFHQCRRKEKSFEYDTLSLFWLIDRACGTERRWNGFKPSLS
jgi:hypothetical protein